MVDFEKIAYDLSILYYQNKLKDNFSEYTDDFEKYVKDFRNIYDNIHDELIQD